MNSITAYSNPDQTSQQPMDSLSAHFRTSRHCKALWKAEGAAYLLAALAHLALWQVYHSMPHNPPEEIQPPVIEVSLVAAAKPQAAAPAVAAPPMQPQPPKPQVQPPQPKPKPIPKPIPKPEKPAPQKLEKPKPTPKPRPEPEAEAAPSPQPEAAPAPPAPVAAPASPAQAPRAAETKAAGEAVENTRFSQGTVGGYGSRPYPAIARERGWEGTVTAKIRVSADGEIEDVSIASGSGHEVLDDYAIEKIQSASHVKPCHRGDKPVACTFTQSIHFKLTKE